MNMSSTPSDPPAAETAPDLRRSMGEATQRIHQIIDAAEETAKEIRGQAEAEARSYAEERRREADREVEKRLRKADEDADERRRRAEQEAAERRRQAAERNAALDQLASKLADTGEQFKHQADRMLAELKQVIADARADADRHDSLALADVEAGGPVEAAPDIDDAPASEDALEVDDAPDADEAPEADVTTESSDSEPTAADGDLISPVEPEDDGEELPPLDSQEVERERPVAAVSAYPGVVDAASEEDSTAAGPDDQTAEALLRATQLAVTGKDRDEIADVLRSDFPDVETKPLLDEILG